MPTTVNKPVLSITNFGGIAPELAPADLPAGPAVYAENIAFDFVGAVSSRDGIQNEFGFLNLFEIEVAGMGVSQPGLFSPNEAPWINPNNVTLNTPGMYATVTLNSSIPFPITQNFSFGPVLGVATYSFTLGAVNLDDQITFVVEFSNGAGSPDTLTDQLGNTYTLISYHPGGGDNHGMTVYNAPVTFAGSPTITLTTPGASDRNILIQGTVMTNVGNILVTSPVNNSGFSGSWPSVPLTVANPSILLTFDVAYSPPAAISDDFISLETGLLAGSPTVQVDTAYKIVTPPTPTLVQSLVTAPLVVAANGTFTLTLPAPVTAGNTVAVFYYVYPANGTLSDIGTPSDDQTNTYTAYITDSDSADGIFSFTAVATDTDFLGNVVTTLTSSGNVTIVAAIAEINGTVAAPDVFVDNKATATALSSGAYTTTAPGDFVLSFAGVQTNVTFTQSGGWAIQSSGTHGALVAKIEPTATTDHAAVTASASIEYRMGAMAFTAGTAYQSHFTQSTSFGEWITVLVGFEISTLASANQVSQQLIASDFNLNLPLGIGIAGLSILIDGFQTNQNFPAFIQVMLTEPSTAPEGSPMFQIQLPATQGEIEVGGIVNTWGYGKNMTPQLLNDPSFGVSVVAFDDDGTPSTFSVSAIKLKPWLLPPPVKFNYLKSFEQTSGTFLTMALDSGTPSSSTLWQENVQLTPNGLTSVYQFILPNTFAVSATQDDREFFVFSDLQQGTNQPYTYDFNGNFNRLSQVGPGAPPGIGQSSSSAPLTAAADAVAGNTTYTGTFSPFIPVGISVTIGGFTNDANNGTFTVVSCDGTTLVVNNPGGVSETDPAVVTYAGQANTIVSIKQQAPVLLERIMYGAGLGNSTSDGNVLTFYGESGSIGASLPGVQVGTTIIFTFAPSGSSAGDGGDWGGAGSTAAAQFSGTYVVTAVSTAALGPDISTVTPCFTAVSPVTGHAKTGVFVSGGIGTYQITQATITVSQPIPNLGAGQNITVAGTSIPGYDGAWNITSQLNGGQMSITNSAITSNVATYTYTPTAGQAIGWQAATAFVVGDQIIDQHGFIQQVTQAGTSGGTIPSFSTTVGAVTNDPTSADVQWTNVNFPGTPGGETFGLVTVTGCTNGTTSANNPLNVTNAQVTSATANTFTCSVTASDISSGAENGAVAVINSTIFTFDPGKILTSPSLGGTIVQQGGLANGTRQAVVLFLTEAGLITQPSPPVTFNLSADAQAIICSQIPTGPNNVVARIVAFTEAGQQGVPGAFFYYLPVPTTTVSPFNANQQITYTSTVINNNSQTTATFSFTDAVLLGSDGIEIDVQGADNFGQIELGASLGVIPFSNRMFAWGVNSKVNNLINYSYDGGIAGGVAAITGDTTFTPKLISQNQASTPVGAHSFAAAQHVSGFVANSNGAGIAGTLKLTFPSTITAGHGILLCLEAFNYGSTPVVTDNHNNLYQLVRSVTDGEVNQYTYLVPSAVAGTTTITINTANQSNHNSHMVGIALDMFGTTTVDVTGSNFSQVSPFNTGTVNTTNTNDVILSYATNFLSAAVAPTAPSGYTLVTSQVVSQPNGLNGADPVSALAFKIVGATGVQTPSWTQGAWNGTGITVALKLNVTYILGQTQLQVAFTKPVTTGDTLIVAVEAFGYTVPPVLSDGQTNTYTLQGSSANGLNKTYIYSAIAGSSGANTVTIKSSGPSANSYMFASIMDWQGFLSPVTLDGAAASNAASFNNSAPTGQVEPTLPSDLIISTIFNTVSSALTVPPTYTLVASVSSPAVGGTLQAAYLQNKTPGSFNPTWTRPGAITFSGCTVAFKLNPTTGGDVPNGGGNPLGWIYDPAFGDGGSVQPSPLGFGSSYVISNDTGSPITGASGMITQPAYQDYLKVPIFLIQEKYSARVTALCSSGSTTGSLVVDLFSPSTGVNGTQYPGACVIPLSALSGSMRIITNTLLTTVFPTFVPQDLQYRVYGLNLPTGAKIYIDRTEPFLTESPLVDGGTSLLGSYVNNFEAFNVNTGRLGMATENQQPVKCAFTLFDQLIGVKSRSMYSTTDNGTTEPSLWSIREISNKVGTPSSHGVAIGEGYALICDISGLFLWDGGQPIKISDEIQPLWDSVNWAAGYCVWITNDVAKRRISIGLPLATPNQFMPDFPASAANPTTPTVVLTMSYKELNTASAMSQEGAVRQTFAGTLKAYILGRKWAVWSIVSPYAALCDRPDGTQQVLFGNGVPNSKIYQQIEGSHDDDGAAIFTRYMTYGFPKSDEAEAKQMGQERYLALKWQGIVSGAGTKAFQITTVPDYPDSPRAVASTPQTLANPPADGDLEMNIQRSGFRLFFDHVVNAVGAWFKISRINISLSKEPYTTSKGWNNPGGK